MIPEMQQAEYAYFVKIETTAGLSATVPIAFFTPKQIESFLRVDFKRLVQESGVKGARIHIERAITADYEKVLGDLADWLRSASMKVA